MNTLIDFSFAKLLTPKAESYKYLKRTVSEDTSTSSMVNVPNHFWSLCHSTFWNIAEILNIFKKKDDPHRFSISENTNSENVMR